MTTVSRTLNSDPELAREISRLSLQGRLAFPEVVRRLIAGGFERYNVDLVEMEKTYYAPAGRVCREPFTFADPPLVGGGFAAEGVRDAIRDIREQTIDYPEFLRRIMRAGAIGYSVFLTGSRAIYFGRSGDFHVEPFPSPA